MRIISGIFRGKKILEPNDSKTRPLKDLVKESIFNIIKHSNKFNVNLTESNILDLYSGVGSFGIECLSRGAKKVIFVENYSKVLLILRKNLENLNSINNYEVLDEDIEKLKKTHFNEKFNIIFLDPPFKYKELNFLLNNIYKLNIIQKKGIVILHRHKKEDNIFVENYNVIEEKKYGLSKIFFLSLTDQ